ncbi:unnamed protein product [Ceratitis capitata]|uniref:(Mediterranean fruit fly) hypothetical protein n=1 Tax=Ceratitis capitata TaxID=7213 RepID=A0A811V3W1_CERCA|nr:unnamed protein product [Ceratitis capitata]
MALQYQLDRTRATKPNMEEGDFQPDNDGMTQNRTNASGDTLASNDSWKTKYGIGNPGLMANNRKDIGRHANSGTRSYTRFTVPFEAFSGLCKHRCDIRMLILEKWMEHLLFGCKAVYRILLSPQRGSE